MIIYVDLWWFFVASLNKLCEQIIELSVNLKQHAGLNNT